MSEPWKTIICDSEQCISEMFGEEDLVVADYKIYPDVDTEGTIQFTCPRCGKVETWGETRSAVARVLYERFK
jgi:predicted RNA-binding Zn-ribbon protein involved in translation (DUF1610 family)